VTLSHLEARATLVSNCFDMMCLFSTQEPHCDVTLIVRFYNQSDEPYERHCDVRSFDRSSADYQISGLRANTWTLRNLVINWVKNTFVFRIKNKLEIFLRERVTQQRRNE
jgi:hypothetical protein